MEGKIAAIGDTDFVMPFSAIGVDTFSTGVGKEDSVERARSIIDKKYTLVIVSEDIADEVEKVFSTYQNLPVPCIVILPFTRESEGLATKSLGKLLKMATGINILQNN